MQTNTVNIWIYFKTLTAENKETAGEHLDMGCPDYVLIGHCPEMFRGTIAAANLAPISHTRSFQICVFGQAGAKLSGPPGIL